MANELMLAIRNGVLKTLPSGLEVYLRPIDTGALLSLDLPQPLLEVVDRSLGAVESGEKTEQEAITDEVNRMMEQGTYRQKMGWYIDARTFGQIIARHCFVNPRVVDNPQTAEEISVDEIPTEDLLALSAIVNLPLKELIPFRFEQSQNLESVPAGEGDLPVAQPDPEPVGVGAEPDRGQSGGLVDV